ncbi:hypothetical protein SAMN05421848_2226 [Kushneria avicenniae]|uniref:Uncharacterized protein n=1 Tax=Kushneria avicenniae TaxID=402385 RepID=A0A1I1L2H8_9GAMM|nr:hypothetical protein SAMN05421848_2226 [Kushneria avicenniae]
MRPYGHGQGQRNPLGSITHCIAAYKAFRCSNNNKYGYTTMTNTLSTRRLYKARLVLHAASAAGPCRSDPG